MNTSEILDLAADKIQSEGWVRGGSKNNASNHALPPEQVERLQEGYCLEGAIFAAMGIPYRMGMPCDAKNAVKDYLGTGESPWAWNDSKAESADHVIEVLRGAAAVERTKEAVERPSAPLTNESPSATRQTLVEGTVDTREEVHA